MTRANARLCRQATILRTMTNSYNVNHFWQAFENRTVFRRRQLMQLSTDCLGADFETGSANAGSYQLSLDGESTGCIKHNASPKDIESALLALRNVAGVTVVTRVGLIMNSDVH